MDLIMDFHLDTNQGSEFFDTERLKCVEHVTQHIENMSHKSNYGKKRCQYSAHTINVAL